MHLTKVTLMDGVTVTSQRVMPIDGEDRGRHSRKSDLRVKDDMSVYSKYLKQRMRMIWT